MRAISPSTSSTSASSVATIARPRRRRLARADRDLVRWHARALDAEPTVSPGSRSQHAKRVVERARRPASVDRDDHVALVQPCDIRAPAVVDLDDALTGERLKPFSGARHAADDDRDRIRQREQRWDDDPR